MATAAATKPDPQLRKQRNVRAAPGRLYAIGKSYAIDSLPAQPAIDEGRMSATFTISTPTPDRSEDVMNPRGCLLNNYAKNPVVYFDHGFNLSLPIAKSEDENGELTVSIHDGHVEATGYFSQKLKESQQIFDLVVEKILRTSSVRFTPVKYNLRASSERGGYDMAEWELLEWSVVGIPDNPEAVRKIIDGGKLAGDAIAEPILKSLLPYAASVPVLGKGWTPICSLKNCGTGDGGFQSGNNCAAGGDGLLGGGDDEAEESSESTADASDAIKAHSEQWQGKLTDLQKHELERYTQDTWRKLNPALRDCPETLDCLDGDNTIAFKRLSAAIEKAGALPEPVTVYRGIDLGSIDDTKKLAAVLKQAKESGKPISFNGIVSSSINPSVATSFAPDKADPVFEITAKRGAYLGAMSEHSYEKELIQSHGTKYRVVDGGPKQIGGVTRVVIRLEEV